MTLVRATIDAFLMEYFQVEGVLTLQGLETSTAPSAHCTREWLAGFRERGDRLLLL